MMDVLGRHAGFVIASYAIAAVVVIGLIVWIRIEFRIQRRQLADLEAHGAHRRSERIHPSGETPE